jgi:ribosome maturation factor rimP
MIKQTTIEEIVSAYCSEHQPDYYTVEIAVHPGNRIVVELGSDSGISIDVCIALSKHIEAQLDRDTEDFELEVGSAGITSPFKVLRQYTGAIGDEVEVLRRGGIKEKGTLTGATSEQITLQVMRMVRPEGAKRKIATEETITIPFSEILQTKRTLQF